MINICVVGPPDIGSKRAALISRGFERREKRQQQQQRMCVVISPIGVGDSTRVYSGQSNHTKRTKEYIKYIKIRSGHRRPQC